MGSSGCAKWSGSDELGVLGRRRVMEGQDSEQEKQTRHYHTLESTGKEGRALAAKFGRNGQDLLGLKSQDGGVQ